MFMIHDGERLLEPEEAAKEFAKILRSRPKAMLDKYRLVLPHGGHKTNNTYSTVVSMLGAICGHTQRLRGRYVHSRKGKYLRRHTQRISWLDDGQYRAWP